ncbi:MAG: SDR family oxidoreductase [Bacteroidales bacterium]
MKSMILVTGATGTIGQSLVKELTDLQAGFRVLVRSEEKAEPFRRQGIEAVIGDLSDRSAVRKALAGVRKVFLLSATSPEMPQLQGNMVKEAASLGVEHIVKISAMGSDPAAGFNIGRWHGVIEEQIRESNVPFTFLHCHSFMQNLLFDAATVREEGKIYSGQGAGAIPMVDTRDIAAVAAAILTSDGHRGKVYRLTGPEAITYHDIARLLTQITGREVTYVALTPDEAWQQMTSAGMPEWLADDMRLLNKRYGNNESAEVSNDVNQILGRPALTIEQFLTDYRGKFI